jgi:hypothetical protein
MQFLRHHDSTQLKHGDQEQIVHCTPADAKYVTEQARLLNEHGEPFGSVQIVAKFIEDVLNTDDKWAAKMRGHLEDAGADTSTLSDLDVAIIEMYMRDIAAEQAQEAENPFGHIEFDMQEATEDFVNGYHGEDE